MGNSKTYYSDFLQKADDSLQEYQYNGIDYLYNLEPQQLNLFMVDKFYDPACTDTSDSGYNTPNGQKPDKLEYRIKSIEGITLPAFQFDEKIFKSGLRVNIVSTGKSENNKVTLSWHEDAYLTTRRYHMNWMNHWYNRYLDCMVCGQKGKYRNMSAYLFHYVNMNETSASPILAASPIARFEWKGLIPENLGTIDLDASKSANEELVQVPYRYNSLGITFYPYERSNDSENGDRAYIGGMAKEIQNDYNGSSDTIAFDTLQNTGIVAKVPNAQINHQLTYFI